MRAIRIRFLAAGFAAAAALPATAEAPGNALPISPEDEISVTTRSG